jgi:arylamine N-acetyltransferase
MVNIVTIDDQRYLVDVGFGSNGPPRPVPLIHDHEFAGIAPTRGRLQYRNLEEHTDPSQRVWVYSAQESETVPFRDMYNFVTTEFLPGDFEVMNMRTMTAPQSFFVQSVMCMGAILDDEQEHPVGLVILHRDYVKRRLGGKAEIIEKLETEEQRVQALEKYFGIVLSLEEQRGIRGLASELTPKGGHA